MANNEHKWNFSPVGGKVRVKITSGEDIARLGELDRKMWTVLSCPVTGLEFDEKTLKVIDRDGDGKIRVDEVIATAQWLTSILNDPEILLKGQSELPLAEFKDQDLLASAKQILKNLGLEKDSISIDDTADNTRIFAGTKFNGDGIITPVSAPDEALAGLISTIAGAVGGETDRSGEAGITAEKIEQFYAALADFAAWKEAGTPDVFPYGDNTQAALDACNALKDKFADFFMRCHLINFDEQAAPVVDISIDKIGALRGGNLALEAASIAEEPIARPAADGILRLGAVNPAWKGAVDAMTALVAPGKEELTEDEWNAILASFAPYTAWAGAKKGAEVEALGLEAVKELLKEDRKADLLALVEEDKALEKEALSIETVGKVLLLCRDFCTFLNNYVVFSDFYDPDKKAIFQAGRLYIDQRSTDLCIRVAGPNGDISALSGMYILYCACTSEKLGKTMNIAAVLTDGDVDGIRVGKNAVFYDRAGNDWSATVTAIVDNPISIRQAFWAPYKKVGRWINEKIDKSASAKNDKALGDLTSAADKATDIKPGDPAAAPKPAFDIAKFAGIFAAIGMAVGFIAQALVALVTGVAKLNLWQFLLAIVAIMLLISGPSMFIAWRKLRKRDLGPVLNANGWAINAASLVNIKFGKTLTSLAKFPKLAAVDPEARRRRARRRFWCWLIAILLCAGAALYFTDNLECIGLPFHKEQPELVEETPAEEAPAAEEVPQEAPAAASE